MSPKTKKNFQLPAEILEAFDILAAPYGEKEKWIVISAAILAFASLPDRERKRITGRISLAEFHREPIEDLVLEAGQQAMQTELDEVNDTRLTSKTSRALYYFRRADPGIEISVEPATSPTPQPESKPKSALKLKRPAAQKREDLHRK